MRFNSNESCLSLDREKIKWRIIKCEVKIIDNTDMYWDDICWNDVVPDWDENGELPNDEDEN